MNLKRILTNIDNFLAIENIFASYYYSYVNNVFTEKKLEYPLLVYHIDNSNHSIIENSIPIFSFYFFAFDKLKSDNSNVIEIQDDLLERLNLLKNYLRTTLYATNFTITSIPDEAYSEKITGWIMNCKIRLSIDCIDLFFNPKRLSGLKIWLKADYGVVYDEVNKVSEWHDASGNGYVFAQDNPDKQPLYIPSIDSMNNNPCIYFENDALIINQDITIGTFFILANYNSFFFNHWAGLLTRNYDYPGSEDYLILTYPDINNSTVFYESPLIQNNFYINNNQTYDFFPLKKPKIIYGILNNLINWDDLTIGQDRGWSGRFWHGDIYEVIIYDRILNSTEIEKVKKYLKEKYAMDF
jgi:hypothetical protein